MILMLTNIRNIYTKKGDQMAFLTAEDQLGECSVTVFPMVYESAKDLLTEDSVLVVKATVQITDERGLSVLADEITPASDLANNIP